MTGRALLNRIVARAVDGLDESERAEFDALLASPETVVHEQRQRRLTDLVMAGGEIG